MGGTLSNKQTINTMTEENKINSLQQEWRAEVLRHVNKHQNPQMRQLNYERNLRAYESDLKELSENKNKTYYQICKDYLGF